jgi:ribonuclease HI
MPVKAIVHFDGACSGNPGPMGAGAIVDIDGHRRIISRAMGHGTNNEAEYHALILGLLHALSEGATEVVVRGDSQLVLRQIEGRYKVKAAHLGPLLADARKALSRFDSYVLEWIPRDANWEADEASKKAIGLA